MKTTKFFAAIATFAAAATFSAAASATVFFKDYHDAGVWNAYDDQNEVYAMKYRSDQGKDGFWLVVSDGDNPKGNGTDYAILYGDRAENRITAYTYTGANNSDSYETGTYLGTYDGVFQDGGIDRKRGYELTMFSLDVGAINDAFGGDWKGVVLGAETGIWFHESAGSNFSYDADGKITDYTFASQMYLDRGRMAADGSVASPDCVTNFDQPRSYLDSCGSATPTTPGGGSVPAPGGLALVLFGLAGLARLGRRKA